MTKPKVIEYITDEASCKYCGEESCQTTWLVNGIKKNLFDCRPHINAQLREKING